MLNDELYVRYLAGKQKARRRLRKTNGWTCVILGLVLLGFVGWSMHSLQAQLHFIQSIAKEPHAAKKDISEAINRASYGVGMIVGIASTFAFFGSVMLLSSGLDLLFWRFRKEDLLVQAYEKSGAVKMRPGEL